MPLVQLKGVTTHERIHQVNTPWYSVCPCRCELLFLVSVGDRVLLGRIYQDTAAFPLGWAELQEVRSLFKEITNFEAELVKYQGRGTLAELEQKTPFTLSAMYTDLV